MNCLIVDTCGKHMTIAAFYNGKVKTYYQENCGTDHSVSVMNKIEETAAALGFNLKDADFFGAVVGAGSFTGIRIGVSTVKALCFAFKKPCLSLTSFDAISYNKNGGKVAAVIDAKHGSVYACGYEDLKETFAPAFLSVEEFKKISKGYKILSCEKIEGIKSQIVSPAKGLIKAVEKNADKITDDLNSLIPLYIRKSQAEEGR